jgi:hypothetical protein
VRNWFQSLLFQMEKLVSEFVSKFVFSHATCTAYTADPAVVEAAKRVLASTSVQFIGPNSDELAFKALFPDQEPPSSTTRKAAGKDNDGVGSGGGGKGGRDGAVAASSGAAASSAASATIKVGLYKVE